MNDGFSPKQVEQLTNIIGASLSGIYIEIRGINKRLDKLETKMEEARIDRLNIWKAINNIDKRLDKADSERKIIIERLDKADSERKVIIERLDKADSERKMIIERLDKADTERKTIIERLDKADTERQEIRNSIRMLENNVIVRLDQTTKILTRVLKTEIENSFDRQTTLLRDNIDHWVSPLHDRVTRIEKHLNI